MLCFDYFRILKIREMAFGTAKDIIQKKCDVVYMHSNDQENLSNTLEKKCIYHEQYTLVNDLTVDEELIFNGFNKTYKNEIRRAINEGVECSFIQSSLDIQNELSRFEVVYNRMFESKGMKNKFNKKLVLAGLKNNSLLISKAELKEKECIVYHAYLSDGKKTMLMYSASTLAEAGNKETSNLIGRMNKYLHWYDMKFFKNNGFIEYEWGGINSIEQPNGIAKFKMGFNGEQKKYINYMSSASILGKLYIFMVKRRGKEWK